MIRGLSPPQSCPSLQGYPGGAACFCRAGVVFSLPYPGEASFSSTGVVFFHPPNDPGRAAFSSAGVVFSQYLREEKLLLLILKSCCRGIFER